MTLTVIYGHNEVSTKNESSRSAGASMFSRREYSGYVPPEGRIPQGVWTLMFKRKNVNAVESSYICQTLHMFLIIIIVFTQPP
jgi:hypothetical protein